MDTETPYAVASIRHPGRTASRGTVQIATGEIQRGEYVVELYRNAVARLRSLFVLPYLVALRGRRVLLLVRRISEPKRRVRLPGRIVT